MIKIDNKKIIQARIKDKDIWQINLNGNVLYKNYPYVKMIHTEKWSDNDKIRYIPSYRINNESNIIRYSHTSEVIELTDSGLNYLSFDTNFYDDNIKNNLYAYSIDGKVLCWLNNNCLNIEILDETNKTLISNLNQAIDTITDPFYIQISPENDLVVVLGNYILYNEANNYYKCDVYIYNLNTSTGAISAAPMSSHTLGYLLSSEFKDMEGYKLYFSYLTGTAKTRCIYFADDLNYYSASYSRYPAIALSSGTWTMGNSTKGFVTFYHLNGSKYWYYGLKHSDKTSTQLNELDYNYGSGGYSSLENPFKPQVNFITKDGLTQAFEVYDKATSKNYTALRILQANKDSSNNLNIYSGFKNIDSFRSVGARIYSDELATKFLVVRYDRTFFSILGNITSSNAFSTTYTFDAAPTQITGALIKDNYIYLIDYNPDTSSHYFKIYELDTTSSTYILKQTIKLDCVGTFDGVNGGDYRLGTNNTIIQTKDYIILQFNTLTGTRSTYNFYQFKILQ